MANEGAVDLEGIYHQTIAQTFLSEKKQMVQKLKQYGIQALYRVRKTFPVNTVNKYLELKSED